MWSTVKDSTYAEILFGIIYMSNRVGGKGLMEDDEREEEQALNIEENQKLKDSQIVQPQQVQHNTSNIIPPSQSIKKQRGKYIFGVLSVVICLLGAIFMSSAADSQLNCQKKSVDSIVAKKVVPKIFWIYTHNQPEAEHVNYLSFFYYLNYTVKCEGWEVRLVNSLTVYDWLSQEIIQTIGGAMQNSRIDEGVASLFVLALLKEHGGVVVNKLDTVMLGGLEWIDEMMGEEKDVLLTILDLQSFRGTDGNLWVAKPGSILIQLILSTLVQVIRTGELPSGCQLKLLHHNQNVNVKYLQHSLDNILKVIYDDFEKGGGSMDTFKKEYKLSINNRNSYINFQQLGWWSSRKILLWDQIQSLSETYRFIINIRGELSDSWIRWYLMHSFGVGWTTSQSLINHIFRAPQNKNIFLTELPRRNISLCLILKDQLGASQLREGFNLYREQTFTNWRMVLLAKDRKSLEESGLLNDSKVTVVESRHSQVEDIQKAVIRYCDVKGYAVIMNWGDRFDNTQVLQGIARQVQPRDIVGGSLTLKIRGKVIPPQSDYLRFNRLHQVVKDNYIDKLQRMLNHMRVFSIEAFRFIPQFEHRNMFGIYFKDRIIILMTLLEMVKDPANQHYGYVYLIKKYAQQWNVPSSALLFDSNVIIHISQYQRVDREQLILTKARVEAQQLSVCLGRGIQLKIPFWKQIVLNQGDDFIPVNRNKGPQIIPKIIHQVWLGGKLPLAQNYFLKKTKKVYPSYKVQLWGQSNITKEHFPITYELILNLLDYHRHRGSAFSKLATVTDLIRHELLYHRGGFWRDAGMNMLKPVFDHFLRYSLVLGSEGTLRHRWNMGMCFFANAPANLNLFRTTSPYNINRMKIYHENALYIAGPFDFRQIITGNQEQQSDILILQYQYFYAGQQGRYPYGDLCTKKLQVLREGQQVQFKYKDCALLKGCEEKYPQAYGLDHNCFGVSWANKMSLPK